MTWDAVAEVLDIECAFEARSEEPAEGRDKRREARHEKQVNLVRRVRDDCHCPAELRE